MQLQVCDGLCIDLFLHLFVNIYMYFIDSCNCSAHPLNHQTTIEKVNSILTSQTKGFVQVFFWFFQAFEQFYICIIFENGRQELEHERAPRLEMEYHVQRLF